MVSPRPTSPRKSALAALAYFNKYHYPLTSRELWFWQPETRYSRSEISSHWPVKSLYYCLQDQEKLIKLRRERAYISQGKLQFVTPVLTALSRFPFIKAIFITGALAMSNSPWDDDIDIMTITRRHTLWLVRPLVVLYLKLIKMRRGQNLPEHSSARVSDKVCDNLFLDDGHLYQLNHDLFTAHELLQAKCIFDRGGTYRRFISQNSWVGDFLPVAYRETLNQINKHPDPESGHGVSGVANPVLYVMNFIAFIAQYLYMRSRLSSEKIGLGYAYFHPRSG